MAANHQTVARERDAPQPRERILRKPAVKTTTGLGDTELHRKINEGTFPAPFKLSDDQFAPALWLESEIVAWMRGAADQWRKDHPQQQAVAQQPPPKRPRGRPRKAPPQTAEVQT